MVSNSGSFLICVPRISDERTRERFTTVGRAVIRIAELLGADIEVSQKDNYLSVWVYYKSDGEDWRSVYFDWGKNWSEKEVLSSLRSELHHACLHQRSLVLQSIRVS